MAEHKNPPVSQVASSIKDERALSAGRERLLKGARECFATKGFGGTSVQDIAVAAGISVGSLYKYVRAKEDLLWLMAEESHARLHGVVEQAFTATDDPVEALGVVVEALVRNADEDRDMMNLLYAEFKYMPREGRQLIRDQERGILAQLVQLIDRGNRAGAFHCEDTHLVAVQIEMMGSVWVLKSHLLDLTIEDYIERQVRVARTLVGARQG